VLTLFVGVVVGFFGFNTLENIRKQTSDIATNATNKAVAEETNRLRDEINKKVQAQFETPAIQAVVKIEAKKATQGRVNTIIVEQVNQQVGDAVKQLEPTLNVQAKSAVDQVVKESVRPTLNNLQNYALAEKSLILAPHDAYAYDDAIRIWRDNDTYPPALTVAAGSIVKSIKNDPKYTAIDRGGCLEQHSLSQLISMLNSSDAQSQNEALPCLTPKLARERFSVAAVQNAAMDRIFQLMTTGVDLATRARAFYLFKDLARATPHGNPDDLRLLDNAVNAPWWQKHRSEYIHQ
jgi:hypothetical protein